MFCLRKFLYFLMIHSAKLSQDLLDWFSPNFHHGRYLTFFHPPLKGTNFMVKVGEIGWLTSIYHTGIPKRSGISQFWFQKVQWRVNLVNFIPVTLTLEFKMGKGVHPLVDHKFSYVRLAAPQLDTAAISSEIFGAMGTMRVQSELNRKLSCERTVLGGNEYNWH